MSRGALLAGALLAAVAAGPAAAAPIDHHAFADDTTRTRVRLDALGGILHYFYHQWYYVATFEPSLELRLSPHVALLAMVPVATVDRDGEVDAGWGNVGIGLRVRHRGHAGGGDGAAIWLRTLTLHVSAPTAPDRGSAAFAARSASDVHLGLDMGDFLPGTTSGRASATLRWQDRRWAFAGSLGYRFHFFTFDRGETEFLQILSLALGVGYRIDGRWSLAASLDSTSDVLEERWAYGDNFRHIARAGVRLDAGRWRFDAQYLYPLDFVLHDDQSPMIGLGVSRTVGR